MKKLNKLLSVFVITGAVSASLGALAACGHTHTFSEDWTADGANGHYHAAACDDYDGEKNSFEAHVDSDHNGECDKCDFAVTIGGAATVVAGQNITLTATLAPTGTTGTVAWSSSDTTKATVNASTGVVTGVAAGTTTITATVGGISVTKQITVTAASSSTELQSITITGAGEVAVGANITLTANKTPATATETITWSSSDATKATVNQTTGVVTGVAEGTVTITATSSNNKTATKQITVTAAGTVTPAVPANADGISVSGVTLEHVLNATTQSANIDLTNMVVKFAESEVAFGDAIAADKYDAVIYDATTSEEVTDASAIRKDGDYSILVTLKGYTPPAGMTLEDDFSAEITVKVKNPVVSIAVDTNAAGSLFTQEQNAEDTISSTWKFKATRANTDVEDVPAANITVGSMDTTGIGANKKVTVTYKKGDVTVLSSVAYSITDNAALAVKSYAINASTLGAVASAETNTVLDETNKVTLTAKSGKAVKIDASEKYSEDGKKFTQRLNMQGSPIKNNVLDGNTIFRTLEFKDLNSAAATQGVTSKTVITIYADTSSSGATRQIGFYKEGSETVDTTTKPTLELKEQKDLPKLTKLTFETEEQGTFHIASLSSGWYVFHIQVDTYITGGTEADAPIVTTDADIENGFVLSGEYKKEFIQNGDFNSDNLTVNYSTYNKVTADYVEAELTSANYTVDSAAYVKGTVGEYTINVNGTGEYDGLTASYTVKVREPKLTAVAIDTTNANPTIDVTEFMTMEAPTYFNGLKLSATTVDGAGVESTVNIIVGTGTGTDTQDTMYVTATGLYGVPGLTIDESKVNMMLAGTYEIKFTFTNGKETLSDTLNLTVTCAVAGVKGIVATKTKTEYILGENETTANVALDDIVVKQVNADDTQSVVDAAVAINTTVMNQNGGEPVQDTSALTKGTYIVIVTANYGENKVLAYPLTVVVKSEAKATESWMYQNNAASASTDPDVAQGAQLAKNSLFTATADVAFKSGHNQDSTNFDTKITAAGKQPTVAAASSMGGTTAIVFKNALASQAKADADTDFITVTAEEDITLYIYVNSSDDKHGSDKAGVVFSYVLTHDGTPGAKTTGVITTNRNTVDVIKVDLKAGDTLKVTASKGTQGSATRVWFYGIEAKLAQN